jgi:hypothetical protein
MLSESDLSHLETTASLTLTLVAELRRAREAASLARAEAHRDAVMAASARRELAAEHAELEAARARILELETAREVDEITDASELETLRGRLVKLETVRVLAQAWRHTEAGSDQEMAVGEDLWAALDEATHDPATVKP